MRKAGLLRRLYSTFAGGWPGTGLILMRLVAGFALVQSCRFCSAWQPSYGNRDCVRSPGRRGILLVLGLCTPIAGTLVALVEIGSVVTVPPDKLASLLLATLAVSLAMLGPGQWSIDARLFGWKRIEPSPRKRQPSGPQESSRSL